MEIRELVKHTSVPAKTIRYYEEIKLLPPPARKPNGYREYSDVDGKNCVCHLVSEQVELAEVSVER